jgi:hypothetical protein
MLLADFADMRAALSRMCPGVTAIAKADPLGNERGRIGTCRKIRKLLANIVGLTGD